MIVATCHRTELYAETPQDSPDVPATLLEWWASASGVPISTLAPHAYSHSGLQAARHLFRVTAGLDSMILGEAQIVGQVASSLRQSVAVHAASPLLKLTFKGAVRAGERARGMVWGRLQAASLGSAAVDAAAAHSHTGLRGRNVLVVGAGEIAELALRSLAGHATNRVTIANRTIQTAQRMGLNHGAHACALEELPSAIRDADVVIAATRATSTLIDSDTVAAALSHRPARPLTLIDVSLPRNVDVAVRGVAGARLIGIDELGSFIAATHAERHVMVPAVERLVDEELDRFQHRVHQRAHAGPHATTAATLAVTATV